MRKQFWLYVLRLEQGKYYVGITSRTVEARFQEHVNETRASWWTKKYKPVAILDQKFLGDLELKDAELYEKRVTRRYMKERGINNVRGGDLTMTSDLVEHFGYIFDREGYLVACFILFQMLVIAALSLMLVTTHNK